MADTAPQFLESLSNIPTVDYMQSLRARKPIFFLKRVNWLVKKIPGLTNFLHQTKFIHITGTSGKGTVGAMLQSILATDPANGRVGFYNSPHTSEVYERMMIIDSKEGLRKVLKRYTISPQIFNDLTQAIKPYLEQAILKSPYGLPSYFEIVMTLALLYFQQKQCKYVILEVGCGGRYDATNIIPQSKLSIITNIDYDHEHLIGPRLTDIAYEKAGIIKPKGQLLIGPTIKGEILNVIKKECREKKAQLITIKNKDGGKGGGSAMKQCSNETIAVKAAQILKVQSDQIKTGLARYQPLPCRFEIIRHRPTIILDGAHNPNKINYLITQLHNYIITKQTKILIFGAVDSKKWRLMLKLLIPYFDKIFLTRHNVLHRKATDLKKMYEYCNQQVKRHQEVKISIDPSDALKTALTLARPDDLILATGSLYLVGYLKKLKTQNAKLKTTTQNLKTSNK